MVKVFKSRTNRFQMAAAMLIFILCLIALCLNIGHCWGWIGVLAPVALWADRFLTRIEVHENGDVWIRHGFTGTVRLHGILQLKYDVGKWKSQQLVLHHTKGYYTVDPMDREAFISYLRKVNPMMEYVEK